MMDWDTVITIWHLLGLGSCPLGIIFLSAKVLHGFLGCNRGFVVLIAITSGISSAFPVRYVSYGISILKITS